MFTEYTNVQNMQNMICRILEYADMQNRQIGALVVWWHGALVVWRRSAMAVYAEYAGLVPGVTWLHGFLVQMHR